MQATARTPTTEETARTPTPEEKIIMKSAYHRIFYELYGIIKKFNPDTAFFTASLMSALFYINIIAVYGVVRFVLNNSFILDKNIAVVFAVIMFLVNQVYFVATKKYKKIIKQYRDEGSSTIIGWLYIISSVVFFYCSSSLHR